MGTKLVWSSLPPPKQWRNGNKGNGQVKAKATKRAMATAMMVGGNNKGNDDGNKGCGQVTAMRIMVPATTVVDNDEGDGNSNEDGGKQRG